MAKKIYAGKAALSLVQANGGVTYVYQGDVVPDGVSAEDLERLVSEGYIQVLAEVPESGDETPVGDTPVPDPNPVVVDGDPAGDTVEPPAKSASKAEWVDYAVSQGMSEEDANAATKDELVAQYAG